MFSRLMLYLVNIYSISGAKPGRVFVLFLYVANPGRVRVWYP